MEYYYVIRDIYVKSNLPSGMEYGRKLICKWLIDDIFKLYLSNFYADSIFIDMQSFQ